LEYKNNDADYYEPFYGKGLSSWARSCFGDPWYNPNYDMDVGRVAKDYGKSL